MPETQDLNPKPGSDAPELPPADSEQQHNDIYEEFREAMDLASLVHTGRTAMNLGEWTSDDTYRIFLDLLGDTMPAAPIPPEAITIGDGLDRSLLITDLHGVHVVMKNLRTAVQHALYMGVKRCIIGGDLTDQDAVSRWEKNGTETPVGADLIFTRGLLRWLAGVFEDVWIVDGNHDARLKKALLRCLTPELRPLAHLNVLRALTRDLPNVRLCSQTAVHGIQLGWLFQIGDTVIGHPEVCGSNRNATMGLQKFADWLTHRQRDLQLRPFRNIYQGHSHQHSEARFLNDIKSTETGCLCRTPRYSIDVPKCSYMKPSTNGYVILVQRPDGYTIRNLSRFYELPVDPGTSDQDNVTQELLLQGMDVTKVAGVLGIQN